jgi:class 3 adenylate cyclase
MVREDELSLLALVELQHGLGFRPQAIEQALRVYGESLRRIAETEAEWWRTEVQQSMLARGASEDDIGRFAAEHSPKLSAASDEAVLAIYHAHQALAWLTNIAAGIAAALENAGLHTRPEIVPAMCFLDISGYTRLTHEQGDRAAAELAERLRRIVERTSVEHGGRPVKWLGDGVMVYFPDPGAGVVAALKMVSAISEAGLLKAHIGLHAGPVVFQEGDYYGQTVNVASRIGDYARPGEVLVSQEVVNHTDGSVVRFREIGPVDLKGVAEPILLHAAEAAADSR